LHDESAEYGIDGCVQNKRLICAKNHGNCLRHFEDVGLSRRYCSIQCDSLVFDTPCRLRILQF